MIIDEELAELLGIHIGDGCISINERYSEYYLGGDLTEEKEYHHNWVGPLFNKKIMNPLFNKDVKYKEHPKVGVYAFYIFDKRLVNFFNELGIKSGPKINIGIPKEILKDKALLKKFIRGLFDTDGCIYFDKNYSSKNPINNVPIILIGTVSKSLIDDVYKSLLELGMHPALQKPYKGKRDKNIVYRLKIYRRYDINHFINEIGFKNPKHYSKWLVFKKLGYCPSFTNLKQRKIILQKHYKDLKA